MTATEHADIDTPLDVPAPKGKEPKAKKPADPMAEFADFAKANAARPKVKLSRKTDNGGKVSVSADGHGYTAAAVRAAIATAGVKYSITQPDAIDGFDKMTGGGYFAPAVAGAAVKMLGKL